MLMFKLLCKNKTIHVVDNLQLFDGADGYRKVFFKKKINEEDDRAILIDADTIERVEIINIEKSKEDLAFIDDFEKEVINEENKETT